MKQIIPIIIKELRLVRSQRMTLALIIVYPLLLILSLGLAFGSGWGEKEINVALFIPNDLEFDSFSADDLAEALEDVNKLNVQRVNSIAEAEKRVKNLESDFGIIVRREKTEEGQLAIELLIDNANILVVGLYGPVTKSAIELTSLEISSEMIRELWNRLKPVKEEVEGELGNVDLYLEDLNQVQTKIEELQEDLSELELEDLQETLESQTKNMEDAKETLAEFESDLDSFDSGLVDLSAALLVLSQQLASHQEKIQVQAVSLQQYGASLELHEQQIDNIANDPVTPAETSAQLLQLKGELSQTRQQIYLSLNEVQQLAVEVGESQMLVVGMQQNMSSFQSNLNSQMVAFNEMRSMVAGAADDLSDMNALFNDLDKTFDEMDDFIEDSKNTTQEISQNLDGSKEMLRDLIEALDELRSTNPIFLSSPIKTFERDLYDEVSSISFVTPVSISLVLLMTCMLFASVSVITEKREGPHQRMKLSSVSPTILIFGKIIGQMVFALLVSLVILLIGILVFGSAFRVNILEMLIALVVISFAFIALGLFITNFAKTQSTATLLSLIIILPMIFLSEIILPRQLMDPNLFFVSSFLPLTATDQILYTMMVRGVPLAELWEELLILLVPALILTAYTIKRFNSE